MSTVGQLQKQTSRLLEKIHAWAPSGPVGDQRCDHSNDRKRPKPPFMGATYSGWWSWQLSTTTGRCRTVALTSHARGPVFESRCDHFRLPRLGGTLAGRGYARMIPRWRGVGYHVSLLFLSLPTPEAAIGRVAERVRQGGHAVPDDVVRRRFAAGRRNFEKVYRPLVDAWALFDNAGTEPVLVDWGENP